jgi:hypothetical protein
MVSDTRRPAPFVPNDEPPSVRVNALVLLSFERTPLFSVLTTLTKIRHLVLKPRQLTLPSPTPHKDGRTRYNARRGGVAERFKAPVLKTGDGASHP